VFVRLLFRLPHLSSKLLEDFRCGLFSWDVQQKLWENLNLVTTSHELQTLHLISLKIGSLKKQILHSWLEDLTPVAVFWDITSYDPVKVSRRFEGTYRLHLQGRRVSQARNPHEASTSSGLKNVGLLSPDYMALYPSRQTLQILHNLTQIY
jgi:hypothetical protein